MKFTVIQILSSFLVFLGKRVVVNWLSLVLFLATLVDEIADYANNQDGYNW